MSVIVIKYWTCNRILILIFLALISSVKLLDISALIYNLSNSNIQYILDYWNYAFIFLNLGILCLYSIICILTQLCKDNYFKLDCIYIFDIILVFLLVVCQIIIFFSIQNQIFIDAINLLTDARILYYFNIVTSILIFLFNIPLFINILYQQNLSEYKISRMFNNLIISR